MSFLINSAMRTASAAGTAAKHAFFGGGVTRMAMGVAAGGIYGMATNDRNSTEGGLGHIARSAFFGGMLGGASRLFTPKYLGKGKFSGMPLGMKAMWGGAKAAPGMAKSAIDNGATLAGMALRNPLAAAGIIGGAYALNQDNKTPYSSPLAQSFINQPLHDDDSDMYNKMNRENMMIDQMSNGISPMGSQSSGTQLRNQRMLASTVGLTQGLHNGRHG